MSPFGRRSRGAGGDRPTLIFFATDIHGSDLCFRKFLNAGKFYGATHLIVGGDITGKSLVPIRHNGAGWFAQFGGRDHSCTTEAELADLQQAIRDAGQYPYVAQADELAALEDEEHRASVFTEAVVAGMKRWMDMADERLADTEIRCYVTPGNDDFWEIDDVIRASARVQFVEGKCVRIDDRHEMITTGYSNFTPWRTEREVSEEELSSRIESMWGQVEDSANAIAVIHVPPIDTALDIAPELGPQLNLKMEAGGLKMTHVGSTAVRSWLEGAQPLLGLFGHVHESKAIERIGRTVCINPGSEYTTGVLAGALIAVGDGKVRSHQLVSG